MIAALLICLLCSLPVSGAPNRADVLPAAARSALNKRFPDWKFAEVSPEVKQSLMKGTLPYLISGDFDGNRQRDYAILIWHGKDRNWQGQAFRPRSFLVVFLQRRRVYRMHVIKEPDGESLHLVKKGTKDYNYDEQKEITYANDAIMTGFFEKGGSSYVYERGRFRTFVSSD